MVCTERVAKEGEGVGREVQFHARFLGKCMQLCTVNNTSCHRNLQGKTSNLTFPCPFRKFIHNILIGGLSMPLDPLPTSTEMICALTDVYEHSIYIIYSPKNEIDLKNECLTAYLGFSVVFTEVFSSSWWSCLSSLTFSSLLRHSLCMQYNKMSFNNTIYEKFT